MYNNTACLDHRSSFTLALMLSFIAIIGFDFSFKVVLTGLGFLERSEGSEFVDADFSPNFKARSFTLFVEGLTIGVSFVARKIVISCGLLATSSFKETMFSYLTKQYKP